MFNGQHQQNISKLIFNFNPIEFIFKLYRQSNQNNTMQVRGQHIRAYQLWHHHNMTLDNMLAKLNLKRRSTVMWGSKVT